MRGKAGEPPRRQGRQERRIRQKQNTGTITRSQASKDTPCIFALFFLLALFYLGGLGVLAVQIILFRIAVSSVMPMSPA
jgi:hypothetical protein